MTDESLDQQALLELLSRGILTPEEQAQARWLASQPVLKPPTVREVLDTVRIDPGPTRAREPQPQTINEHLERAARTGQIRPEVLTTPSGTIQTGPRAHMFGASDALSAMSSGVMSKLMDNPLDWGGAVTEAMGRGSVAPYQDAPPTPWSELTQRGYDPGVAGGILVNAILDPSNLIPSGAAKTAVAAAAVPLAGRRSAAQALKRIVRGGPQKLTQIGADVADDVADPTDEAEELVKGSAGWFPRDLKATLDELASTIRARQKKEWIAAGKDPKNFGPRISEIKTELSNYIRNTVAAGDSKEAQRLIDGYFTTALPKNYRGVNFDARRPVIELLRPDTDGGVMFDDTAKQRLALAFEQGSKRAEKEQWGDSRWLYHLTNGDPAIAAQITRLLGAFSPGQKTDANTLNAIEAFLRTVRGESVESILGRKVPDPGRPGKLMRVEASLSTGHPRPGTVEDNLKRAILFGRLFEAKVEALAGAELGLHDNIPIDLWLMRAIGAQSDMTPGASEYRLISEAMAKMAAAQNENPFTYMAKVWMGMQDIVGTPTLSFAESASRLRLPGNLKSPGVADDVLQNIEHHAAGIKDLSLSGARSPIATNPQMAFPEWEREAQRIFRVGQGSDVLGKKQIIQNPKPQSLTQLVEQAANARLHDDMMRGAVTPGYVTGNLALEAAPGGLGGARPGYWALTPVEQQTSDKALFRTLVEGGKDAGKVRMAEELFPGHTGPMVPGRGYYPTGGTVQRNLLRSIPIKYQTTPTGRGIDPTDLLKSRLLQQHLGIVFGQDVVPMTAPQFGKVGLPKNVVRVWPGAGEAMPEPDAALLGALPPNPANDWVNVHRKSGIDFFKASGQTLTRPEQTALGQAAISAMDAAAQRGASMRSGANIAGRAAYPVVQWGPEGSRQATTELVTLWKKLLPHITGEMAGGFDQSVMANATKVLRIMKKDPNTSPALLNYLQIAANGGITGLKKALKDPSIALPALAAMGVLPTLVEPDESVEEQS